MSRTEGNRNLETIKRTCPICEACCGLEIQIDREAKEIVRIEGDREDFRSQGYVCPKSYGMKGVYEDEERLRRPIRKRPDGAGKRSSGTRRSGTRPRTSVGFVTSMARIR